jgi:hypothetical protein
VTGDWLSGSEDPSETHFSLDTGVPHPARIYDVWLGGKDNYAADRAAAEAGVRAFPATVKSVRANRAFLARAVEYLVRDAGIRQFLDIGTGLPSAYNTHEVAQAIAPEARVVYVDNDPIVLAHARALLAGTAPGMTAYIEADLRDTEDILRRAADVLDLAQPVAVLLIAVLHFIADDDDPLRITRTLLEAVPAGSYLALSHLAEDIYPEEMAAFVRAVNEQAPEKAVPRDRADVSRFFAGLDLIPPGVVQISKWHPRSDLEKAAPAGLWGGIARKLPA